MLTGRDGRRAGPPERRAGSRGRMSDARPLALAVTGSIASGKSTLARALAERLGATLLVADRIREGAVAELARGEAPGGARLRALERSFDDGVYAELLRRAGKELGAGRSVVLDAAFPGARSAARPAPSPPGTARASGSSSVARATRPSARASPRARTLRGSRSSAGSRSATPSRRSASPRSSCRRRSAWSSTRAGPPKPARRPPWPGWRRPAGPEGAGAGVLAGPRTIQAPAWRPARRA